MAVTFEMFWAAYPRKVCKKPALAAWNKIAPDPALAEQIVAAVQAQRLDERERRYIPHPATWLNREQWTDEVLPTRLLAVNMSTPMSKAQLRSQRNAAAAAAVLASFRAESE